MLDARSGMLCVCAGCVGHGFVACGSEDGNVLIWNAKTGSQVAKLKGHAANVSVVTWSPSNPALLVSGSDDNTIRVWTSTTCHDTGLHTKSGK